MKRNRLILLALALLGLLTAQKVCAQTTAWTGHTPEEVVLSSATATPTNDQKVYLYNVGAGTYFTYGGNWGTSGSCGSQGYQLRLLQSTLTIDSTDHTTYKMFGTIGNVNSGDDGQGKYVTYMDGKKDATSVDIISIDRGDNNNSLNMFFFTPIEKGSKIYTIHVNNVQDDTEYPGFHYLCGSSNSLNLVTSLNSIKDDSEKWMIVTLTDIYNAFENAEAKEAQPVPAHFAIIDYDFARNNDAISNWKTGSTTESAASLSQTTDARNTPTTFTGTYFVGDGYQNNTKITENEEGETIDETNPHLLYGKHWTANIHGASGQIWQKIPITKRSGWYEVSCEGFSNDGTGSLFAAVNGKQTGNDDGRQIIKFKKIEDVPTSYVKASRALEGEGMRQAVTVYVPRKDADVAGAPAADSYIVIGAYVDGGTTTSWTCIDNFNLRYLGDPKPDILLDEEWTDKALINNQVDAEGQVINHTLRLRRDLKPDKWNSIILPVTLNSTQVKNTFGGDTKLSKLTHTDADGGIIYFTKVDLSEDEGDGIDAGSLYIIKPQIGMPKEQREQTRTGLTDSQGKAPAALTEYYTVNQVVLENTIDDTRVETALVESGIDNGIKMVGTYVQEGATTEDGSVSENPPIKAGSYILSNGTWYYSTSGVNKVKGMRGWIETNRKETTVKFFINGIEEGDATAIEGIENSMEVSKKRNSNIYNLNGQLVRSNSTSVEGLDKGIYIIGGKKVVVR